MEIAKNYDDLWDLFLLADSSKEIVNGYLVQSEVYVAKDDG